jgi:tRNA (cmo5U34)-methyltransferase
MGQFHFTPEKYLELMHAELPAYDELQDRVAMATEESQVTRILELGTGTGETARRVLRRHPDAMLTGIDISEDMLAVARDSLPVDQVARLLVQGIEDELPEGPFDLVLSALAVHHLDGPGKADLFRRVGELLVPGGLFVMGDVVVPEDPADAVTPLSPDYDLPSSIPDIEVWLRAAGFDTAVVWNYKDLAVFVATSARGLQRSS